MYKLERKLRESLLEVNKFGNIYLLILILSIVLQKNSLLSMRVACLLIATTKFVIPYYKMF